MVADHSAHACARDTGFCAVPSWLRSVAGLWILLVLTAASAAAQGVTGTVSGTVKDGQGGVLPGATVILISESKGTRTTPAATNAAGDFVVPNVPGDTYTVQVEMSSFRGLKRTGLAVSAGSQVAVGTLTLQPGGVTEVVTVTESVPMPLPMVLPVTVPIFTAPPDT